MAHIAYQPTIDGLRAIAVIAVLLFHLDERLLPGGFTGVDVFFAVSGYLITSILLADAQAGGIRLRRFYQRRISRIFPASALVCVAVLLAATRIYMPEDCASAGATVSAAAVSAVNIKLLNLGDYFKIGTDAQPLLHYWTLGVEEQFYLVLPFALWVIYSGARRPERTALRLFAVAALLSLVAAVGLAAVRPTWAFYLLPTRAWELLAGCMLAIRLPTLAARIRPRQAQVMALGGLLLIGAVFCIAQPGLAATGLSAAIPVIGSVLVIAGTVQQQNIAARWLSQPALTMLGRASYSLYLWHWPVYCFVDYELYTASPAVRLLLKVALTIGLSGLAYLAFEKPMRRYLNEPRRIRATFAGFAAAVAVLFAVGVWLRIEYDVAADARLGNVGRGGIVLNIEESRPCIALLGDSNAGMYGSVLKEIAVSLDLSAYSLGVPRLNPFPGHPLFDESVKFLKSRRPEIVIFVSRWSRTLDPEGAILLAAIKQFQEHAEFVILITEPPELPEDASREGFRESGAHPVFEASEIAAKRHHANVILQAAASSRVQVVDISQTFLLPSGEIRFTGSDGRQLFRDSTHLSGCGTTLIKSELQAAVSRFLVDRQTEMPASR